MFARFRDIAAFVLQHATFSHPTSSLPPKFPHVPPGLWATQSVGVGIIVYGISFQDFRVVLIHQCHRRTDRETDDMQSRGKNICDI